VLLSGVSEIGKGDNVSAESSLYFTELPTSLQRQEASHLRSELLVLVPISSRLKASPTLFFDSFRPNEYLFDLCFKLVRYAKIHSIKASAATKCIQQ